MLGLKFFPVKGGQVMDKEIPEDCLCNILQKKYGLAERNIHAGQEICPFLI
jgi:hypothetical protein